MAKFYGTLQGNRGEATRCGSNEIATSAQSYNGSIIVYLWYNDDNKLCARVSTSDGSSCCGDWGSHEFRGTFEEFKALLNLNADIKAGRVKITRKRAKKGEK